MTVDTIIEDARYGELKQLGVAKALGSTDTAKVEEAEREVLSYINLGMTELYKRFNLRIEELTVEMVEGQTVYTITEPLLNTILAVFDENGDPFPLNVEEDINSVNTPAYNAIQVPNPIAGSFVFTLYNSAPERLVWVDDLSTVNAVIPPTMLEALLHYVGYRAHGALDGAINAENNTHYMRFDASCSRLINLGLLPMDTYGAGTKLEDKGFK